MTHCPLFVRCVANCEQRLPRVEPPAVETHLDLPSTAIMSQAQLLDGGVLSSVQLHAVARPPGTSLAHDAVAELLSVRLQGSHASRQVHASNLVHAPHRETGALDEKRWPLLRATELESRCRRADWARVRNGLGKALDEVLRASLPVLLEPAGFTPIKRPRSWRRKGHIVEQILGIEVDGTSARDGELWVRVGVGLTYGWEQPLSQGSRVAGQFPRHVPALMGYREPRWRFTATHGLGVKPSLDEHLAAIVLPALDRFRDPAMMRNHYLAQGDLGGAIALSRALGDTALAQSLGPAYIESLMSRMRENQPSQSPAMAAGVLDTAESFGIGLSAADRAGLLADLRTTITQWRALYDPLPDWVHDLETRYL